MSEPSRNLHLISATLGKVTRRAPMSSTVSHKVRFWVPLAHLRLLEAPQKPFLAKVKKSWVAVVGFAFTCSLHAESQNAVHNGVINRHNLWALSLRLRENHLGSRGNGSQVLGHHDVVDTCRVNFTPSCIQMVRQQ